MATDRHVLIVEDEPQIVDLIKQVAADEGFRVSVAVTGNEAFSLIAANQELYDCVVMDLALPGMNGDEVIEHLARLQARARIVVYSGYIDKDVYAKLNQFEMVVSCHEKPVRINVLRSVFRTISEKGELKPASSEGAKEV